MTRGVAEGCEGPGGVGEVLGGERARGDRVEACREAAGKKRREGGSEGGMRGEVRGVGVER